MTCPYLGLVPLSQDEQPFFAGREKEITVVISSLYASSLTVLYGESGVGKTSLIRAGLLPALEQPEHRVAAILFREWQPPEFDVNLRVATLKSLLATINRLRKQGDPSSPPLDWGAFLETFCQGLNLNDPKINLRSVDDLYALPLDRFIKECCAAFYGRLFFVFDQFEDYIYYHPLKEKGDHFDGELARAINDRNVPASFLISLREDGLGKLNRLHSRVPDLLANVTKLEHLDESGAIQAINKPLCVFNEREGFKVELAPELVTTLLEQADADRLELDEPFESKSNEIQRSDIGIRYKALALQAVLMRLWKVKVEPALFELRKNGETILISRDDLTQSAQGKGKREDEVRFVVRTYFDQQLLPLDDNIRENATEILPHMVRPGSQKKARSINALANESGIPEDRVRATLESLKEKPVELVREIAGAGKLLYELQHDVMAFAVQDWCIRQRQIIRDKHLQQEFADRQAQQELKFKRRRIRLFWYTLIGTAFVSLVVVMWLSWLKKAQETASAKADYLEGEIAIALNSSGAGEYNPVGGLLIGIDTVASFRESHTPIQEKALMSLRLGTLQVGHSPSEAQDKRSLVWRQIPAMESPDQKYLLAIEPGNQIIIFRYDDSKWKSKSYKLTGMPPFEIACSRLSKGWDRIGLRSSDGLVQLWDFSKVEPESSQSSGNLATDLGFSSQIPPQFTKKISDPIDYESLVKNWMLDALSAVTRPYREEDGSRPPKLDAPLMSQKFAEASELALRGKDAEARSVLSGELKRLGFEIEESKISEVLAASFMHRANEAQENADDCFRVAQRLVPSLENDIKVQRELVRGNKLRDEKKIEEAADAYRKAKALDPTLNLNPEEEAKKGGPSVPGA
jgi:hypothetical protein